MAGWFVGWLVGGEGPKASPPCHQSRPGQSLQTRAPVTVIGDGWARRPMCEWAQGPGESRTDLGGRAAVASATAGPLASDAAGRPVLSALSSKLYLISSTLYVILIIRVCAVMLVLVIVGVVVEVIKPIEGVVVVAAVVDHAHECLKE